MNKKRIKSEEGYLAITKIAVRKWAVDVSMAIGFEPVSALDQVLSAAVLLDCQEISITYASLQHILDWDADEKPVALQTLAFSVNKRFLLPVGWEERYLLDYVAVLVHLHREGIAVFRRPIAQGDHA